jgi:hypothetical protein
MAKKKAAKKAKTQRMALAEFGNPPIPPITPPSRIFTTVGNPPPPPIKPPKGGLVRSRAIAKPK